jgi:hypothetical protein
MLLSDVSDLQRQEVRDRPMRQRDQERATFGLSHMHDEFERRSNPRIKMLTTITARLVGTHEMFVLDEASVGGFSVRSPTKFVPGTSYRLRLESATGQATVLQAVCRYCISVPLEKTHVVGFQFVPQDRAKLRLILGAIANDAPRVTSPLLCCAHCAKPMQLAVSSGPLGDTRDESDPGTQRQEFRCPWCGGHNGSVFSGWLLEVKRPEF